MEIKLTIYDENNVKVKDYSVEDFTLRMGTIKKFIDVIGEDTLGVLISEEASTFDTVKALSRVVVGSYDLVMDLMKQVFKGLTDEEYELLDIKQIANALIQIGKHIAFSIGQLGKENHEKN